MTIDHTATGALRIVQGLLDENIDLHDAWIPVRRHELDTIAFALARSTSLEANLANMLTLLNGAAPVIQPPATAVILPAAGIGNHDPQGEKPAADLDWLQLAAQDLDTQHLRFVEALERDVLSWRKLEDRTKHNLTRWIIWRIQHALDDETVTVNLYDALKPDWAVSASALYQTKPFSEWVVDSMEKHAIMAAPFRD